MSIVVHGGEAQVASILKASADLALNFETDVLAAATARRNQIQTIMPSSTGGNYNNATGLSTPTSDALLICKLVLKEVAGQDNNDWLLGSQLAVSFYGSHKNNTTALENDPKERYRRARDCAIQKGWLIKGRKKLLEGKDQGNIVSVPNNVSGNNPTLYSMEEFYRISIHGKMELETASKNITTGAGSGNTNLFVKNIPAKLRINDLVNFFEQEHNVVVIRGNTMNGPSPMSPFIFGRIQVQSYEDADKLVRLSQSKLLQLNGRPLEVKHDSITKMSYVKPEHMYVRGKIPSLPASPKEDPLVILCRVVHAKALKTGPDGQPSPDGWIDAGGVAVEFRQIVLGKISLSATEKDPFKITRAIAIEKGLLQVGRRLKSPDRSGGIEAVIQKEGTTNRYTTELYVRLTEEGCRIAEQPKQSSLMNAINANRPSGLVNVFMKGLPTDADVKSLVHFLETTHDCSVQRATIDKGFPGSVFRGAHVEFTCIEDASRILKLGSSSDGLLFQGRSLAVVADEHIPSFLGDEPSRFYQSPRPDPVPATVSTTMQSMEESSLGTMTSHRSSIVKSPQPSVYDEEILKCDDATIFCRVLYEMPSSMIGDCNSESSICVQWKHSGFVGELFQNIMKGVAADPKQRFRDVRGQVIQDGLVEFGRRDLKALDFEIVVAPYFGGQASVPNLSKETFLRLTVKGKLMAEKDGTPSLGLKKAQGSEASTGSNPNIYISNVPNDVNIRELVDFLEQTYNVTIHRACISVVRALYSSVHIELGSMGDYNAIMSGENNSLVYAGRFLRLYMDRNIPDFAKCPAEKLYDIADGCTTTEEETAVSADVAAVYEGAAEEQVTDKDEYDTENKDETESEARDELNDSALSPPPEVETLATTDLLYGHNLALLYAQCAPAIAVDKSKETTACSMSGEFETEQGSESEEKSASGEIMPNDQSEEKNVVSPDSTAATTPATPLHEAPDFLWD